MYIHTPPDRLSQIHVVASKLVDDSMFPQGDQLTRREREGEREREREAYEIKACNHKMLHFT